MKSAVTIFWFRRDLRLEDNAGLYHALRSQYPVVPVFIFDRNILDDLEDRKDRRVVFIYKSLIKLQDQLTAIEATLDIFYGHPAEAWKYWLKKYQVREVFTNRDYEPYARNRDQEVETMLNGQKIPFHAYKDQVIFDQGEVIKDNGGPYTIFTPYSKKWRERLTKFYLTTYPVQKYYNNFLRQPPLDIPSLDSMGFCDINFIFPPLQPDEEIIKSYNLRRDFPAAGGTTHLSVHLRFGTVSIRELVKKAIQLNQVYLNELIWREFYQMILWHFPRVVHESFKPEYDHIFWRNDKDEFEKWCKGKTGYPIVDAGMRELNATGYMHNRVRMITASFLTKHLLIDWRWGEAYFAKKLLDYDLAANNGGWQWSAGCGCDAAPYFRIFNPYLQTKKFDPELRYVRKWVPELDEFTYPQPIIDHPRARERCLEVYSQALKIKQ
jgi:deoxyribodipyrimidine photo-lyase